jgi:hypothetical protein
MGLAWTGLLRPAEPELQSITWVSVFSLRQTWNVIRVLSINKSTGLIN